MLLNAFTGEEWCSFFVCSASIGNLTGKCHKTTLSVASCKTKASSFTHSSVPVLLQGYSSDAVDIDWQAMHSSWVRRAGFPLLDVERVPGGVNVTQARYDVDASKSFDVRVMCWGPCGIRCAHLSYVLYVAPLTGKSLQGGGTLGTSLQRDSRFSSVLFHVFDVFFLQTIRPITVTEIGFI